MIEPARKNIEGHAFVINGLPLLRALSLDKKISSLLLPIFSGVKSLGDNALDEEFDLSAVVEGIQKGLGTLSDSEYEKIIVDLLACVQYLPSGAEVVELTDAAILNKHFQGKMNIIYKLIIEVMRVNKFLPFALMEGGKVQNIINSITKRKEKPKTNGEGLGI